MTRQIKRMSYPDAALELAESYDRLYKARRELNKAEADVDQSLFNLIDALSRKGDSS